MFFITGQISDNVLTVECICTHFLEVAETNFPNQYRSHTTEIPYKKSLDIYLRAIRLTCYALSIMETSLRRFIYLPVTKRINI